MCVIWHSFNSSFKIHLKDWRAPSAAKRMLHPHSAIRRSRLYRWEQKIVEIRSISKFVIHPLEYDEVYLLPHSFLKKSDWFKNNVGKDQDSNLPQRKQTVFWWSDSGGPMRATIYLMWSLHPSSLQEQKKMIINPATHGLISQTHQQTIGMHAYFHIDAADWIKFWMYPEVPIQVILLQIWIFELLEDKRMIYPFLLIILHLSSKLYSGKQLRPSKP